MSQEGDIHPRLGPLNPLHPPSNGAIKTNTTMGLDKRAGSRIDLVEPTFIALSLARNWIGQTPRCEEGGLYQTPTGCANRSLMAGFQTRRRSALGRTGQHLRAEFRESPGKTRDHPLAGSTQSRPFARTAAAARSGRQTRSFRVFARRRDDIRPSALTPAQIIMQRDDGSGMLSTSTSPSVIEEVVPP